MKSSVVLKDRVLLLRELRHAGPLVVSVLVVVQLVISCVPALSALAMNSLVGRLLDESPTAIAFAGLGAVILAGRLAQVWSAPVAYLAAQRVDAARRASLTERAVSSDQIGVLEQPRTRELLRVARADPEFWAERTPGTGATAQLDLIIRWIGVIAAAVVLASFAWWLAPW